MPCKATAGIDDRNLAGSAGTKKPDDKTSDSAAVANAVHIATVMRE
jgi:hypothetical protein